MDTRQDRVTRLLGHPVAAFGKAFRAVSDKQGSFVVGSLITFLFNGGSIVLYGLGSVLMTRKLGPEQSGHVVWFISATTTIALFADFIGLFYSSAQELASGGNTTRIEVIRGTVLAYGLVVGAASGILFGFVNPVRNIVFPGLHDALWGILILLNVMGLVLLSQIRGLFWGMRSFIALGSVTLAKTAAYAILGTACVYVLHWRWGYQVALAQVVSLWLCVVGFAIVVGARGIAAPSMTYVKDCIRIGIRASGINCLSFLHQRIDQYLVNRMLGSTALGLYGVAVSLGEVITQLPGMLGMVLFPLVAGDNNKPAAARLTVMRTFAVMGIIAVFMLPLGIAAPFMITHLYGEAFRPAASLLRDFLPGVVFLSGLLIMNQHVAGLGYPRTQVIITAAALVSNIILNLLLLPRWNVAGAPISSSISYGLWFACMAVYLWSLSLPRRAADHKTNLVADGVR